MDINFSPMHPSHKLLNLLSERMALNGKVALITGGAQGIGKAYCNALACEGIKIAICDVNETEGLLLEKELNSEGKKSIFLYCDVTKNSEFEECFKKVISVFGRLDIVVNNAGILNDNLNSWEREVDINLCGVIRGTLFGLKYLKKGGTIVATSSLAGVHRDSVFPIYAGTKGGVNYFVRSIGSPSQLAVNGIRVIAIAPSMTDTPLTQKLAGKYSINPALENMAEKRSKDVYKQKPESVAACLVHILKEASSGSIWLVQNDVWQEIDFGKLLP